MPSLATSEASRSRGPSGALNFASADGLSMPPISTTESTPISANRSARYVSVSRKYANSTTFAPPVRLQYSSSWSRSFSNFESCLRNAWKSPTSRAMRDNWAIKVQSNWDKCEHKTKSNKDEREVKCDAGFDPVRDGNGLRDTCVKKSESYSDPACPAGYDYKSQGGRDTCQKESGVDTVKPFF